MAMTKFVATAKLSSKGQIVLPKKLRDAHGWKEGMEFEIVDKGREIAIKPARQKDPRFPTITVEEFLAMIPKIERPFPSDEEIEKTILEEAARRFREKCR
jgi:AbrB family looped-hinge helix DNA binding protein